ncbi:acyl-CoA desaturase [Hymenobacter busanensis]|uniref:Acyl-CoA desaturase n=1 Tax=Hymenobacter busanensis TaxID=2607656 RepID=A0A7L5A3A1_9BACT|nr:acyl-CoA desaturase [Hymenobacter busanensis]KAA9327083.1 acyl-CoA desaturase [Hymenobacter busanensis]QHJ09535.1 acyl-CoA desaturase [Hymenobacter busanensis]
MLILVAFVAHWYLSLFTQTFFQHRYAAHRMFTMHPLWERFFFVFTFLMQGSSFMSPRGYALLHRMHHAYSDTEQDPHSPHYTANAFTMMWKTRNVYQDVWLGRSNVAARFEGNYPEWVALENLAHLWYVRVLWGAVYVAFYVAFATEWWMYLLLPIHFMMGAVHGAIVNWGGHKYGYQNFDNHDKSRNSLFFDFLTGGELFQNNHHKLSSRANFGVKWWEFDPTYPVIWTLDKLHVIRLRAPKPTNVLRAA